MRLTFGDMTREVNVFYLEKQPRMIRDQTFEINFVENNCDEESEGIENESRLLMNYLRMNAIILMRRHMSEILILESSLKQGNLI